MVTIIPDRENLNMKDKENFLLLCNKAFTKIAIVIGILCIILYLGVVLSFSSNYPFWDDYDAILGYLNYFVESSMKDKILSLFWQHNEHRIVFNRIIEIIQYYAFGNVNFYYLILIGNLGWFLSIWLLIKYVRDSGFAWVCTIPIIVIMTSFAHYESMTWAMCSIQQYYQLLFALVTIYLLVRQKIFGTLFALLLSIYTGGGGLVLMPLIFFYTVLNRDLKKFFLYNIFSIFILGLYFVSYNSPSHHPLIFSLKMCIDLCEYALLFIGGVLRNHDFALSLGVIAIPLFFFKIKSLYLKSPFVFWSMVFVIGIAFATGLSRVNFGVDQALSSRYSIYSILFWSLMYTKFVIVFESKNNKQLVLVLVAFLCSLSVYVNCFREGITYLSEHKNIISSTTVYPNLHTAINRLQISEKKLGYNNWRNLKWYAGAVTSDELVYKKGYWGCWGVNKTLERCISNVDYNYQEENIKQIIISNDNKYIYLDGWSLDPISGNSPCGTFFKMNNNEYYSPIVRRKDVVDAHRNKMVLYSGFHIEVDLNNFPKGNYKAELITVGEDCKTGYKAEEYNVIIQ